MHRLEFGFVSIALGMAIPLGIGCARSHVEGTPSDPLPTVEPPGDAGPSRPADAGAPPDAASAAFAARGLVCDLSEDEVLRTAALLSACHRLPLQTILGYWSALALDSDEGRLSDPLPCELLRCASAADTCDTLRERCPYNDGAEGFCDEAVEPGRCVGDRVEQCLFVSPGFHTWVPVAECAAVAATCAETSPDGRRSASCVAEGEPCEVGSARVCEGSAIRACVGGGTRLLSCPDTLPGTTCTEDRLW